MFGNEVGNMIGKTIICGHINTSYAHRMLNDISSNETFKADGIICLDGMTIISNLVNCEVFDEDNI